VKAQEQLPALLPDWSYALVVVEEAERRNGLGLATLAAVACRCTTTREVHAMSTTTKRLSIWLVATMFIVLIALMATFGVRSAEAAQPVGECPASYEPGLVTVKYVLKGANLDEPDASMDINGDGYTCLKLLDTGSGTRASWHDNTL
jgi:hypothetical protein